MTHFPDQRWACLSREVIYTIRALTLPVVEVGAGDGVWARELAAAGVPVTAWDLHPRGQNVQKGSHHEAAANAPRPSALLAVWPPDGAKVSEWIAAAEWRAVILCGHFCRFDTGDTLNLYTETATFRLPGGCKGPSTLRFYERVA